MGGADADLAEPKLARARMSAQALNEIDYGG